MAGDFQLIIMTGMSGAGKSRALQILEDMGYFCVDNLPPVLIPKFAEICREGGPKVQHAALVVDIRGGEFFTSLVDALQQLAAGGYHYRLLFLDATDNVLVRRYKETRRAHPLAPRDRILQGLQKERALLRGIKEQAASVIDTSELALQGLKGLLQQQFKNYSTAEGFNITVVSFGFKFGTPLDLDMMLDVRFLPNPFYLDELKHSSGRVPAVSEYIGKWDVTKEFMQKLTELVDFLTPHYEQEGKQQWVIGVGCTGGMHRSVWVAEALSRHFKEAGYSVSTEHRDLFKNDVHEDYAPAKE